MLLASIILLPALLDVFPRCPLASLRRIGAPVPDHIDSLPFTVLVLQSHDTVVEVPNGREVVSPLLRALFSAVADGVERLKLPPGVFLPFEKWVSEGDGDEEKSHNAPTWPDHSS